MVGLFQADGISVIVPYAVMVYIVIAFIVMAHIVMAHVRMAYQLAWHVRDGHN